MQMSLKLGMLWKIDNPELQIKKNLETAFRYWKNKEVYSKGKNPNCCVMAEMDYPELEEFEFDGKIVKIEHSKSIRPNHLFIGVV